MGKSTNIAGQPVLCQLLSFIPKELVDQSVSEHQSDRYYKTMTAYKQLVFLLYGIITKCHSLNNLCKNLLFLEDKLTYLGIDKLPATSTLSDANIGRDSTVFATLYGKLHQYYRQVLQPADCSFFEDHINMNNVSVIDSSTITLFVDLFKGSGRNTLTGKKKGGLKIHTKMPMTGFVPDLIHITEAASNDKIFLGQLRPASGTIYVFDKGYANYQVWKQWTEDGVFYVTRLNENASYQVIEGEVNHISEYANGGIIKDQRIRLEGGLIARLITYKDYESGKVLSFISNMFEYHATTIIQLYKYRWNIEVLFKRLKQNFELSYFFSDSSEGIKTQIWIALIANLLFSVIHRQIKEVEMFVTLVNVAANNMGSYISLIKVMKSRNLSGNERNLDIIQLEMFTSKKGGVFQNTENTS